MIKQTMMTEQKTGRYHIVDVQKDVHLTLSIHDECTFLEIAAAHGMSPVEMIERFIHDTVRGSETTVDSIPVLAYGYTRELERHNQDGSFKFPVFILEQYDIEELFLIDADPKVEYSESDFRRDFMASWIEGDGEGHGYATTDYWSAYLAYCECMREKPESIEQAAADMKATAEKFFQNVYRWTPEIDFRIAQPGLENLRRAIFGNHDADPDGSGQEETGQAEPGDGDPEQE